MRRQGCSYNEIAKTLSVSKSSVSLWVRDVKIDCQQANVLNSRSHSKEAVEKRRISRLRGENAKRQTLITKARKEIDSLTKRELWLMGIMLYWAEGGKTQRMVRFSNGDPEMIKMMMSFFREVCFVPEEKFRGYIHIHPHLSVVGAEVYWSEIAGIPLKQFFKTYSKKNVSSKNKRNSLPYGVLDVYVMDVKLFLKISGWAQGVFMARSKLSD